MKQVFFSLAALVGMSLIAAPALAADGWWTQYNSHQVTLHVQKIAEVAFDYRLGAGNDVRFDIVNFGGDTEPDEPQVRKLFFLTNAMASVSVELSNGDIAPGTQLSVKAGPVGYGQSTNNVATWSRLPNGNTQYTEANGTVLFRCGNVAEALIQEGKPAAMFEEGFCGHADLVFTAASYGAGNWTPNPPSATLTYTITLAIPE